MKAKLENMRIATAADWEYCQETLPRVSRTFALNIVSEYFLSRAKKALGT